MKNNKKMKMTLPSPLSCMWWNTSYTISGTKESRPHFHFPSLCHYDIMTFIVIVIVSITFLNNRAVEAEKTDDTELVAKVLP